MTKYLFGDLVRNCKEKVDRDNNPYEYFVAGDHMETERPKLTMRGRFDESDVGPAFIRMFKPGQVLYGSRRTYLKKVSVADFEGVTSNVTFVLETKDESILPQRLLPFLLLSDRFTSYSIGKSKGSTNPYVLFSDLADFELDLPEPKAVAEIADIMCAAERLKEDYRSLIATCDDVVKSQFVEMFGHAESGEFSTLRECCMTIQGGKTPSMKHPEYYGGGIPFIKSGDVKQDIVSKGALSLTERALTDAGVKLVPNDSVLVVTRSAMLHNKMYSALSACRLAINQDVKAFIPLPDYLSSYLLWAIRVHEQELLAGTRSVSTCALDFEQLCSIEVQKAPIQRQEAFASFVSQVDKSKFAVQKALDELNAMTKKIMNQELGLGDV